MPPRRSRIPATIHSNGVFDLNPDANYDAYPDIKAYLCLLGTISNHITWFHTEGEYTNLSPCEQAQCDLTDEAVRRGVDILINYKRKKTGLFAEPRDRVHRPWSRVPWLPATLFFNDAYKVAACLNNLITQQLAAFFEEMNPVHGWLIPGNVLLDRPAVPFPPSSLEFVLYIRAVYGIRHPLYGLSELLAFQSRGGDVVAGIEGEIDRILFCCHAHLPTAQELCAGVEENRTGLRLERR